MRIGEVRDMLHIDGSHGEGGGQVLRTSLALSCALGTPFEITNIRKGRQRPGLQPQHLTAVKAAAAISSAEVLGAELSSTELRFLPGRTRGGAYRFDVAERKGSAGSTGLVLQTVLLPLCLAKHASIITVLGGTHVPWSPSFQYLSAIVTPLLERLGVRTGCSITSWGWYPLGLGEVSMSIEPVRTVAPLDLIERGRLLRVSGLSAVSNLPEHIAARQRQRAMEVLDEQGVETVIETISAPSRGKGSFLFLCAEFEHARAGFSSLGAIGKRAEEVADDACAELLAHLRTAGSLDPHLADQIVPWCAFANGPSEFTTSSVTRHLLTNSWAVRQFLDIDIGIEGKEGEEGRIRVRPTAITE